MCLFINAVVPRSALTEAFAEVVRRHRLCFVPCDEPLVQAQLRASEQYVRATAGLCDCGSRLFCGQRAEAPESLARQVEKLRKKKWSDAKIERWLASTAPGPSDANAAPAGTHSLAEWAAFLDDALRVPGAPYIGLVGHTDQGRAQSHGFRLGERVVHAVSELYDGAFRPLEEDVVHEFRLHRGR